MPINKDEKLAVQKRIERSAKFQRAFSGTDGEYALGMIDDFTNYKGNTFDPDPYLNAYKAGQRSMAVFIHNVLEQDVEKAIKILDTEVK